MSEGGTTGKMSASRPSSSSPICSQYLLVTRLDSKLSRSPAGHTLQTAPCHRRPSYSRLAGAGGHMATAGPGRSVRLRHGERENPLGLQSAVFGVHEREATGCSSTVRASAHDARRRLVAIACTTPCGRIKKLFRCRVWSHPGRSGCWTRTKTDIVTPTTTVVASTA